MKLIKFRVQNFKSFLDSGWVDCKEVTAVAGVNEAGKSNLLKALWKLKPAFKADNKIVRGDLPIDKFDEMMESNVMPEFITARFRLRPYDKELINQKFEGIPDFNEVEVSRFLDGHYSVKFPVEIPKKSLSGLSEFIVKIMPGFVFYGNYGNLDSNIYLPQMIAKFNKNGVNAISKSKRRTVKLLLMYIGITPEMLACDASVLATATRTSMKISTEQLHNLVVTKERYANLLRTAGERLTREFNQWWRQGSYKFEFTFDGENLAIFVTDDRGIRAPLDDRSIGIQWFLSFFLVFTLESQLFYTNAVMLLDESGATLHGLAQQDLLRFFDELAKSNQIIYTTHSSYMLPTTELDRTKIVYKDERGHSIVSTDFSAHSSIEQASMVPISTSLGMQISDDLLSECTPVVVIDEVDRIYLNYFKSYLNRHGLTRHAHIVKPVVFVHAGVNGLAGTCQMLTKNGVLPCILIDAYHFNLIESLYGSTYKNDKRKVVALTNCGRWKTLEDLIPLEIIANACGAYIADLVGQSFSMRHDLPFLEQLRRLSNSKPMPSDFREQIAEKVIAFLSKDGNDRHLKINEEALVKLFDFFTV